MTARRDDDTDMGGRAPAFPHTRHSAIAAARSTDADTRRRGFETIAEAYWKPVYKYVRRRWNASNDDAKELTQSFLARAFEKDFFLSYEPARASFRTFLRTCLERHVAKVKESDGALRRGGAVRHVEIDSKESSDELGAFGIAASDGDLDGYFHREWMRSLFERSLEGFRAHCAKHGFEERFAVFERYDLAEARALAKPSYAALAVELGTSESQVTNHLAWSRREFRRILLEKLREISSSDDEFRADASELFGRWPA